MNLHSSMMHSSRKVETNNCLSTLNGGTQFHTMEYCLAIEREALILTAAWTKNMLTERSLRQRPHDAGFHLYKMGESIETRSMAVVSRAGGREMGRDCLTGMASHFGEG